MGAVAVLALFTGLCLSYAPPAAPAEVTNASSVGRSFGEQIELIGYRWEAPQSDDKNRRLTLLWRGLRPIETDLRTSLRLLNDRGAVIWEWKRSPGAGRFSTDRWPAGRLVADVYAVPADILSRATSAEIGVRPFPEGPWLRLDDGASSLALPAPRQRQTSVFLKADMADMHEGLGPGGLEARRTNAFSDRWYRAAP